MDCEEKPWRHQKKSRKKRFHIERKCVVKQQNYIHEMYVRFGYYDWHRYRSYETEAGRDAALHNLQNKTGGHRLPGEWEYRKEEDVRGSQEGKDC